MGFMGKLSFWSIFSCCLGTKGFVDDTAPVLIRESRQVSTAPIAVASAAVVNSQSLNPAQVDQSLSRSSSTSDGSERTAIERGSNSKTAAKQGGN